MSNRLNLLRIILNSLDKRSFLTKKRTVANLTVMTSWRDQHQRLYCRSKIHTNSFTSSNQDSKNRWIKRLLIWKLKLKIYKTRTRKSLKKGTNSRIPSKHTKSSLNSSKELRKIREVAITSHAQHNKIKNPSSRIQSRN